MLKCQIVDNWCVTGPLFPTNYYVLLVHKLTCREPLNIFPFELCPLNSCYFMDDIFYRNVIACFFVMIAREILVYLLLPRPKKP